MTKASNRPIPARVAERAATEYVVAPNGCHMSTRNSYASMKGYVYFLFPDEDSGKRRGALAHRAAYQHWNGPVPEGHDIDHTCHNIDPDCAGGPTCLHRRCVRREHLEAVPPHTNVLRGRGPAAVHARKTVCPRCAGPYTFMRDGKRRCTACANDLRNERRRAARAAAA